MSAPTVVILAAGRGTRMRSGTPKLLHQICGRSLIRWSLAAARAAGAARIVVVDAPGEPLRAELEPDVTVVVQERALGTGDAARAALAQLDAGDTVIVLNADLPLISAQTIESLAAAHARSGAAATLSTAVLEDPAGWGRVLRAADGSVTGIVETRRPGDASAEQLQIHEVNTGIYAFAGAALISALGRITAENAQHEYYLTDVAKILSEVHGAVRAHQLPDAAQAFNVNDRVQLAAACATLQRRILERHMLAGVTIVNPAATAVDVEVTLGEDVTIEPGCGLHGATSVGARSTIGPHTTLRDTTVGCDSSVIHSYGIGASVHDHVSVGPFAYLRSGTVLRDGAKAGTFVEIKNSDVGARTKVPHLSYVGDTMIGEDTNLGASTITANYDGYRKNRTTIGARVHTAVDTTFVAPVSVGDDAYTAAGSVITKDVPAGALGVARARQANIDGYAARVRERERARR